MLCSDMNKSQTSFKADRLFTLSAAMYVRMSTENQNYSTDHQRATISTYADGRGMEIVKEYADEGKSGLGIKGRAGLTQLIKDVQSGTANFAVILVYDVSRWGRFQDVDEAAYHEHTCRRAGIQVIYCAEQFNNDGSPLASLLKSIKRTMAAEYSRELSIKVFSAQCRFVMMGFKQGGNAGYGLRRVSMSSDGVPRRTLAYKERKGAPTDRVILALGPAFEVATVRRVYSLYIDHGMGDAAIARLLNAENIKNEFGGLWSRPLVTTLLTNMKYSGALVFNRRSCKLSRQREHNPSVDWVVNENAFERLLSPALFKRAQCERLRRSYRADKAELLDMLRNYYKANGKITAKLIDEDRSMPDSRLYARRFGSLMTAYDLAGLSRREDCKFALTKRIIHSARTSFFADVCSCISASGHIFQRDPAAHEITIDGDVRVRVETAACRHSNRASPYWMVAFHQGVDFILIARMNIENTEVLDYLIVPIHVLEKGRIYLRLTNPMPEDCLQFDTVHSIFGLHSTTTLLPLPRSSGDTVN